MLAELYGYPTSIASWLVWLAISAVLLAALVCFAARVCGLNHGGVNCSRCHAPIDAEWRRTDEWQASAMCGACLWGPLPARRVTLPPRHGGYRAVGPCHNHETAAECRAGSHTPPRGPGGASR